MRKYLFFISLIFSAIAPQLLTAQDEHGHESDEKIRKSADEHKNEHANEDETSSDEDHSHEEAEEKGHEEGSAAVGPDKGILEKGPKGIRLSPEAIKTFDLKFAQVGSSEFDLPKDALVEIRDGRFVYVVNENWISRVKAEVIQKRESQVRVRIAEFNPQLQVIVKGVGFVRGAELIAAEGATHSH
jgi:hypothetical protein